VWALGPESKSQDSDDDEDSEKENKKHKTGDFDNCGLPYVVHLG
jgi:hypothetical protein